MNSAAPKIPLIIQAIGYVAIKSDCSSNAEQQRETLSRPASRPIYHISTGNRRFALFRRRAVDKRIPVGGIPPPLLPFRCLGDGGPVSRLID
ncbi:MAG TPA: hypothetical protein VNQ80_09270 [Parapedobacter sp.]|uniref:hypothetical protein n=1 Tax=Parapedobacter sp. TaxID=1958893 RepID=UPI002B7932DC|nr:hypothetical protein [Parapedobacter sp.]HWK57516.1 hypothetical protein [Parapedobacter sp.]